MKLGIVKRKLPHQFKYRGKNFEQSFYSGKSFKGRSNEIIWEDKGGKGQVYLIRDSIEYIPYGKR